MGAAFVIPQTAAWTNALKPSACLRGYANSSFKDFGAVRLDRSSMLQVRVRCAGRRRWGGRSELGRHVCAGQRTARYVAIGAMAPGPSRARCLTPRSLLTWNRRWCSTLPTAAPISRQSTADAVSVLTGRDGMRRHRADPPPASAKPCPRVRLPSPPPSTHPADVRPGACQPKRSVGRQQDSGDAGSRATMRAHGTAADLDG
jgi:hypothetical protein